MRPNALAALVAVAFVATTSLLPHSVAAAEAMASTGSTTTASALETVMLVTVDGEVHIDEAGAVTALRLDTPLPDDLRGSLEARVRAWRFEPVQVDGQPRKARSGMRIVLAANEDGDGFKVHVDNVTFVDPAGTPEAAARGMTLAADKMTAPRYPEKVLRMAALNARVMLGIQVGADGKVVDVVPVQSALYDLKGRSTQVARILLEFERSAIAAARQWTFTVPADAATRSPQELTVMVPVTYGNPGAKPPAPGGWRYTIRTPKSALPWVRDPTLTQAGADDLPNDSVVPLASALRLLTDERGRVL